MLTNSNNSFIEPPFTDLGVDFGVVTGLNFVVCICRRSRDDEGSLRYTIRHSSHRSRPRDRRPVPSQHPAVVSEIPIDLTMRPREFFYLLPVEIKGGVGELDRPFHQERCHLICLPRLSDLIPTELLPFVVRGT